MIRDFTEADLHAMERAELRDLVLEEWSGDELSDKDTEMAVTAIEHIAKLPATVRALVASFIASDQLFCRKCGETSCIHGYPD